MSCTKQIILSIFFLSTSVHSMEHKENYFTSNGSMHPLAPSHEPTQLTPIIEDDFVNITPPAALSLKQSPEPLPVLLKEKRDLALLVLARKSATPTCSVAQAQLSPSMQYPAQLNPFAYEYDSPLQSPQKKTNTPPYVASFSESKLYAPKAVKIVSIPTTYSVDPEIASPTSVTNQLAENSSQIDSEIVMPQYVSHPHCPNKILALSIASTDHENEKKAEAEEKIHCMPCLKQCCIL